MIIFTSLAAVGLLVAGGVIWSANHRAVNYINGDKILQEKDYDEQTRYAHEYIQENIVEPLQLFNEQSKDRAIFARAFPFTENEFRALVLVKDDPNAIIFRLTEVTNNGRFIQRDWNVLKIKFMTNTEEVFVKGSESFSKKWLPFSVDALSRIYYAEVDDLKPFFNKEFSDTPNHPIASR